MYIVYSQIFLGCMTSCFLSESLLDLNPSMVILHIIICVLNINVLFEKSIVPLTTHCLVTLFYTLSSLINANLGNFYINVGFQTLFRSSSIVISMFTGYLFYKKRYSKIKITSAIFITIGIIVATPYEDKIIFDNLYIWILGMILMFFSCILSSFLGHFQGEMYKNLKSENKSGINYTNHTLKQESMFYNHFLSLPFLLPSLSSNIKGVPDNILPGNIILSYFYNNIMISICISIFQYLCILSVYKLIEKKGSLHCVYILTLRKFLSVILSIFMYQNEYKVKHYIGCLIVFISSYIFISN